MSLGNFMHSPVGFGAYGDSDSVLKFGLDLVKGAAGQVAGPVEIRSPSKLAGAKLTSGFKIIEEGTAYKIVLDSSIPGLSSFTGKIITGKDPITENLGPFTLQYIPPPANYTPFIIAGAIGLVALIFFMTRGKAAPAARRRRKRKARRRRGRRRKARRRRRR